MSYLSLVLRAAVSLGDGPRPAFLRGSQILLEGGCVV